MSDILKALSTANTGAYLIPEVVDEAIRDYTRKEPVLYNAVTHLPWATNTYFIRKRTANPTVGWRADGGSLPSATNSTYAKVSKAMKYLYGRGEVTGPEIRAAGSLYNALALEVEVTSRVLVEQLSADIWSADGSGDNIMGIVEQIEDATNSDMNHGSTEGVLDVSGESDPTLSQNMLDRLIDKTRGEADLLVTTRKVRRAINSLLQDQQQFVNVNETNAGFRVLAFDGRPIVSDLNDESDDDKVAAIRRSEAKLFIHQDFTFEELAKTKDSVDFMIKWYGGFALEGRPAMLKGFDLVGLGA